MARHVDPAAFPGYARIFDFEWPSAFSAIDIVAWDVFFGLPALFAVPAHTRRADASPARKRLVASGSPAVRAAAARLAR